MNRAVRMTMVRRRRRRRMQLERNRGQYHLLLLSQWLHSPAVSGYVREKRRSVEVLVEVFPQRQMLRVTISVPKICSITEQFSFFHFPSSSPFIIPSSPSSFPDDNADSRCGFISCYRQEVS